MRRRSIFRVVLWCLPLYLVVGAVLTVRVAWWRFGSHSARNEATAHIVDDGGLRWEVAHTRESSVDRVAVRLDEQTDVGAEERREMVSQALVKDGYWPVEMELPSWAPEPWVRFADVPDAQMVRVMESREAVGWPMRCLTLGRIVRNGVGVDYDEVLVGRVPLPRRPLLPGFVVNVLFFGAWAAVGHAFLVAMWRARLWVARWSRGLCVGCGYDRQGLAAEAVCPECGEREEL